MHFAGYSVNSSGAQDKSSNLNTLLKLWAKTEQGSDSRRYHPLLYHLLDVAAVAKSLWSEVLSISMRERLVKAFGDSGFERLIIFTAAAHDIGKATPGFQKKVAHLAASIELPIPEHCEDQGHGPVATRVLENLGRPFACPSLLATIAGGHHGVFPRSEDLHYIGPDALGNRDWEATRKQVLRLVSSVIGPPIEAIPCELDIDSVLDPHVVPVLAAFITVADWIGSNQDHFACTTHPGGRPEQMPADYWFSVQKIAETALKVLGWLPKISPAPERPFEGVFPFSPNHLQEVSRDLTLCQRSPYLMIIEAPMGLGKTEAALFAADQALCRGFARGLYVAMPTQATTNAMFKRVLDDYLRSRGHSGKLNLQLVHGSALLSELTDPQHGEMTGFEPSHISDDIGDVHAQSWFTAKKRPLLAPLGVGTIDQSLLSVLQTRHWFVRLFGLAGKVVIFDEVHAYDSYMSTILDHLLRWLAELDCTVILLSATLPRARRHALIKAYSGSSESTNVPYPRISLAAPRHYCDKGPVSSPTCHNIAAGDERQVSLEFIGDEMEGLKGRLGRRLEHGGCAAVICNTVDRAIEVYQFLEDQLPQTECLLFHARTLQKWRRQTEDSVLRRFGKLSGSNTRNAMNSGRPRRVVLVATQVVEQSLDLDFDLMVSEMAPADLLLQRAGRLHRHRRPRPTGLEEPTLIVITNAVEDHEPPESFGKSIEYVYDRYILLRTWLTLRDRPHISIPRDVEQVIENVYGDADLDSDGRWASALATAKEEMDHKRDQAQSDASVRLVPEPCSPFDLLEEFNAQLEDDDNPEVHKQVKAVTRQGNPSIATVFLPENTTLSSQPSIRETKELLQCSASISHRGLFSALLIEGEQPAEWSRNSHLRYARLVRLDANGNAVVGKYRIKVSKKLGVVIQKEGT